MSSQTISKHIFDMRDNVRELSEALAGQLGFTTDKIFNWYVNQAVVFGWVGTIVSILIIVTIMVMVTIARKEGYTTEATIPAAIIIFLIDVIPFVLLVNSIMHLLNPEYYAAHSLLKDLTKGGTQ